MTEPRKRSEKETALLREMGQRIADARGKMSQRELGEKAGLDAMTISRIENGKLSPSAISLAAIASALCRTTDSLMFGEKGWMVAPLNPGDNQTVEERIKALELAEITRAADSAARLAKVKFLIRKFKQKREQENIR